MFQIPTGRRDLVTRRILVAAVACLLSAAGSPRVCGAVIDVTTLDQRIANEPGTVCTLQEAIYAANTRSQTAIATYNPNGSPVFVTTGCVAGTGSDTIQLPTGAFFQLSAIVDDAINPAGPTATPIITSNISIEANGATLQWAGGPTGRLFTVASGGVLTIRNAYIKGFKTHGGNGANGGGGGMGAGGAIYVLTGGQIVVDSCTFDGNGAVGGNGSSNQGPPTGGEAGGGGGGLSGNGGGASAVTSGGGGGSRGNGGDGDGGGTVFPGQSINGPFNFKSGFQCGGAGGGLGVVFAGDDGSPGQCPGGGGGGGASDDGGIISASGNGGRGAYGGGGGGGGLTSDGGSDGGVGGFGGGGGGGTTFDSNLAGDGPTGGDGGFGGGGGSAHGGYISGGPGKGGAFGGSGNNHGGGGGAALGGAIFNDSGTVTITNSTFTNNYVNRGVGSGGADPGQDAGGAIFSRNGILEIVDATISGNQGTGSGAGVVVVGDGATASFTLNDTIVFNNGSQECFVSGSVNMTGLTNLIDSNGNGGSNSDGIDFVPCPGAVTGADPHLGPLQLNAPGLTPTMAIPIKSSAQEAAASGLAVDQRGLPRPSSSAGPMTGLYDIGAFEVCLELEFGHFLIPCSLPPTTALTEPLTIVVTPPAAGSTTPAVGTSSFAEDSIAAIKTIPKPGYSFQDWTGNVADPYSASTTVIMNAPQSATANYVSGTTELTAGILLKSGPQNQRIWPVSITDTGVVVAHRVQINSFTLTQTMGAACAPVLLTNLPALVADIPPASSASVALVYDFTGCAANARFTAQATFSANGGALTGSMTRTNQLP